MFLFYEFFKSKALHNFTQTWWYLPTICTNSRKKPFFQNQMIGTSEITGLPLYLNETRILSEKIIENKANYETSETNAISNTLYLIPS